MAAWVGVRIGSDSVIRRYELVRDRLIRRYIGDLILAWLIADGGFQEFENRL
jgi:hypothetical protein